MRSTIPVEVKRECEEYSRYLGINIIEGRYGGGEEQRRTLMAIRYFFGRYYFLVFFCAFF